MSPINRREFLTDAAAIPAIQAAPTTPAPRRHALSYPRKFTGRALQQIAFPLGGIGAGSISLGGRGQFRDWEIFNRADKGHSPKYGFASIFVKAGENQPVARVLEARFQPPYQGASGLGYRNAPGLPRLAAATFTGEFPIAHLDFDDPELPVRVSLEAFTPFIPLDADASGLPVAVLRYEVVNTGASSAEVAIAFSLNNPVGDVGRTADFRTSPGLSGLLMRNPFLAPTDPLQGSFALGLLDARDGEITYFRGWPQAPWGWTGALLFWDDFSARGRLEESAGPRDTTGSLCLKRTLPPGARATYTFLLAWHFPNRTPERCGWGAPKGLEKTIIGNHYCTRFPDAWQAAEYTAANLPDLERRTRAFVSAIHDSTLPGEALDAAMSNLSTLVSPTCFRTADGIFHGFEGSSDTGGCCMGTCTHVWNYETATAFLFPTLSRSRREASFGPCLHENGLMEFRQLLPSGQNPSAFAAADGQMGQIMKLYLDWQLSGDDAWLRRLWPGARRALEFAWIPGGWDGDRDGVMEGVQHNTYDVEFFGPNPLCGVWYLGALRAAEEMARTLEDGAFAAECRRLFDNGSRFIDANLFNGEYYVQHIRGIPKDRIAPGTSSGTNILNPEQPDYQVGDGCLVDQLAGQYFAGVAGLGALLDPAHIRSTAAAIRKYNYKSSLYHQQAVQRVFALNDEAGLVICDYARGQRPRIPFPYFGELMTGFEYTAAVLMLQQGLVREGLEAIAAVRRRHDGERRNPWNEPECGHHYARAMASWSALIALSGFQYSGVTRRLAFRPLVNQASFSTFWSAPCAWGRFARTKTSATVTVAEGTLPLRTLSLPWSAAHATVRHLGRPVPARFASGDFHLEAEVVLHPGQTLEITAA
jgi:non-lysosomal glucosylceramidase